MKLILILLFAFNASAFYQETPLKISNWDDQINIDQEKLIDFIYSEVAWNYFVGDDGEECHGWISKLELTSKTTKGEVKNFTLSVEAYLEEAYHCLHAYDLICEANFSWNEGSDKYYPYNWEYLIECSFE